MLAGRKNFNKTRRLGFNRNKFIYSKRSYANPFFQNKRSVSIKPSILSKKIRFFVILAITFLLILIWLIFFSNSFKINTIEVTGTNINTAKEIEALARDLTKNKLIGKNNLIFFSKKDLMEVLNEKYYLENLKINKKFPHSLIINIQEEQPKAIWREEDNYYFIDNHGEIINQIDSLNINRNIYPVIENLSANKINDRQTNIDNLTLDFTLNLFNEYKNKKHDFDIEKFIIDNDINTVKMAVLGGPKIYFNSKEAINDQVARLDLIIKEKLKDSFMTKEYINLKYGNNVYIK
jgi:hypothetical protein